MSSNGVFENHKSGGFTINSALDWLAVERRHLEKQDDRYDVKICPTTLSQATRMIRGDYNSNLFSPINLTEEAKATPCFTGILKLIIANKRLGSAIAPFFFADFYKFIHLRFFNYVILRTGFRFCLDIFVSFRYVIF